MLFSEPLSGIEPETSPFAYTLFSKIHIQGLDCILFHLDGTLLSVVRASLDATVLTMYRSLTVIEDSLECYHSSGQNHVRSTMGVLYQLSYNGIF